MKEDSPEEYARVAEQVTSSLKSVTLYQRELGEQLRRTQCICQCVVVLMSCSIPHRCCVDVVRVVTRAARERGEALAGAQRMRIVMQKLHMPAPDRQRDPDIVRMMFIEALKVDIERWKEDIKAHRIESGNTNVLLSGQQEVGVAAQRALNALVEAIKGK